MPIHGARYPRRGASKVGIGKLPAASGAALLQDRSCPNSKPRSRAQRPRVTSPLAYLGHAPEALRGI